MSKLEKRADERVEAVKRGESASHLPPLEHDQEAYARLQTQHRAMESVGATAPPSPLAHGIPRITSRGSLLPVKGAATGRFNEL